MAMPMPDNAGRLLSVEDVADQLGVTQESVRRWLRDGELRGIRLGGKKAGWRIRASDLQTFLDKRTSGGTDESAP